MAHYCELGGLMISVGTESCSSPREWEAGAKEKGNYPANVAFAYWLVNKLAVIEGWGLTLFQLDSDTRSLIRA
jgi:hypothetical protein